MNHRVRAGLRQPTDRPPIALFSMQQGVGPETNALKESSISPAAASFVDIKRLPEGSPCFSALDINQRSGNCESKSS